MKTKSSGSDVTSTKEEMDDDTTIEVEVIDKDDTDWIQDDKSIMTIDVKMIFFFI
jgi:hypothetical protein